MVELVENPLLTNQFGNKVHHENAYTTLVVTNSARIIKVPLSTSGIANFPEHNFSTASKIASLTGTSVYSDVTPKEITTSSWSREMFLKLFTVCFD